MTKEKMQEKRELRKEETEKKEVSGRRKQRQEKGPNIMFLPYS